MDTDPDVHQRAGPAAARRRAARPVHGDGTLARPPLWLAGALACAGLVLGGATGVLAFEVVDLHAQVAGLRAHDLRVDVQVCAAERASRAVDAAIVTAAGLPVRVPPLTREDCP